jgi:hypothetical protein
MADGLSSCPLVFDKPVAAFFISSYKIFARHSARNNSQMISEASGIMPNFAGFEKFFAHMTFKAFGASCDLSQTILRAPNPAMRSVNRFFDVI